MIRLNYPFLDFTYCFPNLQELFMGKNVTFRVVAWITRQNAIVW
jgi:hypothetical protein